MKRGFQNLSCAFTQVAIKDFEYKKQNVFCLSQITDRKRFGKHTENFLFLKRLILFGDLR